MSNESGTYEVCVQPYPGPGEKIRISAAGGMDPIWSAKGRELLYRSFTSDGQHGARAQTGMCPLMASGFFS